MCWASFIFGAVIGAIALFAVILLMLGLIK